MQIGPGGVLLQQGTIKSRQDRQGLLDIRLYGGKNMGAVFPVRQLREIYRHPADPLRYHLYRNDHPPYIPGHLCATRWVRGEPRIEESSLHTRSEHFTLAPCIYSF